ncbi:hypothetical protein LguiB_025000 [Lonicera macranthoides]
MEYWGNALEGRGLLFYDDIELQVDNDHDDGISNPRNSLNQWDMKTLSDFDKNLIDPNPKTIDNMEVTESDFHQIISNSLSSDPSSGCLATEISDDSSKAVSSVLGVLEFGSRVSSSVTKSSNQKSSSPVDLRLRGLADSVEINNCKFSKGSPVLSSVGFSSTAKRARKENFCSQVYVCQVYGCNKDLSSSKEYYKRHKVCDVHSKASKVFVKGIEQRFCQQCSRFHLLAEFDDGKRSCRKRLAGHNERRRKPHMVTWYGKSHRLLNHSQGSSNFLGASVQQRTTSLFRPVVDMSSTVQELSGISNSRSALSLLSAQWQSLSSHSASIPMSVPQGTRRAHHYSDHSSGNGFYSSRAVDLLGTCMVPNAGVGVDLEIRAGGDVSQSLEYVKTGATVDLHQLSSQLQRVEQIKNSMLVKPENEIFCCFPSACGV